MIAPDGIDTDYLRRFKELMLSIDKRFVIVCGGGKVCRDYQKAASILSQASDTDLDWIGIKATKLNAELVRVIFGDEAFERVLDDPEERVKTDKKIIIGSGFLPGSSSDKDAVLLAKNFGSGSVINLSNIAYVFDKDPSRFDDAKALHRLSWDELLKITGKEWSPGKNIPFDPAASILAKEAGIRAAIMDGKNLENLKSYISGRPFEGTIIS